MKKITAVVVGFGSRGNAYASYALDHPQELEIVGVADSNPIRTNTAAEKFHVPAENIFQTWQDLLAQPKMADFAILSTQDNMHFEPALALIDKGYDLLLEKPMAPTPQQCKIITEAAEKKGVKVVVCHVLRFTPFWRTVKNAIDSGRLGKVISIIGYENVGNLHQSHSYVRGNWRNTEESSCMIMAKCCHDMDILQWLIGKKCTQVQSFGSLSYFRKENQPAGAPDRCMDGCPVEESCPYSAYKLYLNNRGKFGPWFRSAAAKTIDDPTDEQVRQALETGPYGRCVYACDNDVVDHQVVNLQYEDGCTVSFTMNAFNEGGRAIHIYGTEGELISKRDQTGVEIYSFATREWETVPVSYGGNEIPSGHGGGDTGIVVDYLRLLRGETPSNSICDIRTSYENHITGFAAEQSRLENRVVSIAEYERSV